MTQNQNDTRCAHNNRPMADPTVALGNQHRRKNNLTAEERVSIVHWLLL